MNAGNDDEIAKMISKMTISQLQDYTVKLQNDEINISQNIYKLINNNINRFDSLSRPQVEFQETINEYIEQLKQSINVRNEANEKLDDISKQLNTAKEKVIQQNEIRKQLEPYIQYKQLASNLQKYQNNIESQTQTLSCVLKVYDYIAEYGLNESLELFYNANNEQLFQFFTDLIQQYQESDFDDKYFNILIQLGISETQILKISAGILDQQLKNYDIKKFISVINTLYSQFQTTKPYCNNKVMPEIKTLLNKQLQAENEQLPSYIQQIYQLFNIPDQKVTREQTYKNIFLAIDKKINVYTDGITNDHELESEKGEIYEILQQKAFIYVSVQMEQFIEKQIQVLIQQLNQSQQLDLRLADIYKEIAFSQSDITNIQKVKSSLNKQLQFYYSQFPDEVKPSSQQVTDFVTQQLDQQIFRSLKNAKQDDIFKKLYSVILGAYIWPSDWQQSIINVIAFEFEKQNKYLYEMKATSIEKFVEICKYLAHTTIHINNLLRHKQINGTSDQLIARQIQSYLREENEVSLKNFIQHNKQRKDMKIISQLIQEQAQSPQSPVSFIDDQFITDDVTLLKNVRKPIYYALTKTISNILLNQQHFFQQYFNNNSIIQILLALLSIIFVISSIINESESELVGQVIDQLFQQMECSGISLDELNKRFHDVYS